MYVLTRLYSCSVFVRIPVTQPEQFKTLVGSPGADCILTLPNGRPTSSEIIQWRSYPGIPHATPFLWVN